MDRKREFTAIIEREGDGYTALCPEVDVASQGDTEDQARENLREAVVLLVETASPLELDQRVRCGARQVSS
jgi:predicted RNase H-like HicB family nuclease